MASPVPAPDTVDSFTISPVVVEWPGNTGEPCFLGNNPRAVALAISTSQLQTNLDLRVSLELRKPLGKTKLHLYIPPDRIISASMDHASRLSDSAAAITQEMACLRLNLDRPVDFVAPSWPLRPTNTTHSTLLDLVQVLACQTTIGLHFPTDASNGRLEHLHQMLLRHQLTPMPLDLKSLYTGHGGVLVKEEQLAPEHIVHSPPSYDETEAGLSDRPVVTSKKRRIDSPTNSLVDLDVIGGICSKILAEQLSKLEERFSRSLKTQEEKYETKLKEQADRYETAMREQEEKYSDSLEEYSKSCYSKLGKLENDITDSVQHCEEQISYQVDEMRTDLLAELDDLKFNAAQSIQDDIASAVDQMKSLFFEGQVNIVGGKLEFP